MSYPIILSYVQAEPLLAAYKKGRQSVEISPDLGLSTVTVQIHADGVLFQAGNSSIGSRLRRLKKHRPIVLW